MNSKRGDLTFLDRDELIGLVFHPRKQNYDNIETDDSFSLLFEVDENIAIGGRFFRSREYKNAPNLLLFHGNGEIASDYDNIASIYQQLNINLIVFDYRGYGKSTGKPSFSSMLKDADSLFHQMCKYLKESGYKGSISVMGRSLGSAPAIELASSYQDQLKCLIIESGFANTYDLLRRLGVHSKWLPDEMEEEISNIPSIQRVKIPTLIIHGDQDIIIPLSEGINLYKNVGNNNKYILIIPNAGHNDLLIWGIDNYMDAIRKILI